jgi:hypothetical protein
MDIKVKYISTRDEVADIFTKGHNVARFSILNNKLQILAPTPKFAQGARGHGLWEKSGFYDSLL